ncbi:hypothetical protein [Anaerosporobacter faecicola]|uniref:hypothetical protein n=1 Tax=Anaerosporobacter faecicola TaxID=2718714 RepID=UPI00143B195A|nr:hypothetical protein [Anaerosporobacter faecicola]
MSKVGKTMNSVTEGVVKVGGVVTKCSGEVLSEIGKTVGVSKNLCDKVEDKADMLGKDMYYASRKIGHKVEKATEEVVDGTKRVYENMTNKIK